MLGAVILTALLVIVVPEWLDGAGHRSRYPTNIEVPATPVFTPMKEITGPETKPAEPQSTVKANESAETQRSQSSIHAWALQVGSFSENTNALVMRDRMRAKGYAAYVDKRVTDKSTQYRVRIGPELDRSRIDKLRDKVLKEEKIQGMVVKHP